MKITGMRWLFQANEGTRGQHLVPLMIKPVFSFYGAKNAGTGGRED